MVKALLLLAAAVLVVAIALVVWIDAPGVPPVTSPVSPVARAVPTEQPAVAERPQSTVAVPPTREAKQGSTALRPATIYAVGNPNKVAITVEHTITNTADFCYSFTSTIAASQVVEYHLLDMPAVPSPFTGSLTLTAGQPFTAAVVGYDYGTDSADKAFAQAPVTPTTGALSATPAPTSPAVPAATPAPASASASVPSTFPHNVSSGQRAWASGTAAGSDPALAVDGDETTAWQSAAGGAQWLAVDLGGETAISRVTVLWGAAYAKRYYIEFSNDGNSWRPAWKVINGKGYEDTTPEGVARYVRIEALAGVNTDMYQLRELHVFGVPRP